MAISTNILLAGARGAIGKQLVVKQYAGKMVISAMPYFEDRVFSPKQVANHMRMMEANEYARDILSDPDQRNRAQVRLNVLRNRLYHALVREFYRMEKEREAAEGGKMV